MRCLLLTGLLLASLTGFTQVTKKKNSAPAQLPNASIASGGLAVMPTASVANGLSADTTYLSASDFSGTGTVSDPIRIKTSVIQTWLQSLPGFNNGGGKYLASDFTWKPIPTVSTSPVQLNAPSLAATSISSSAISLSWNDVANETGYLLQRSQDNASWVTVAQPATDNAQFTNTGLSSSTLYYYRIKALGDNTTYGDSPFGSGSATTQPGGSAPPSAETLLFNTAASYNVQQHPDGPGTYYSSQGSGLAQALKKLPAGADGLVYFQYQAGTGELLSLGYIPINGIPGYNHWTGGLYLFGTRVKAYGYNGSTTDLGVDAVDKHFYGFRRNGNVIEIVTSANETTWTVLGYANYEADDLYIQAYFQTQDSKIKVFARNLVSY